MSYSHTQHGPLHYLIAPVAVAMFLAAWLLRSEVTTAVVLALAGGIVLFLAFCFMSLTISDEGDRLLLCFGPAPLFRKSFLYADIHDATAEKSKWVDGWGIHWVPGRGWTYNLWGFDCVELKLAKGVARIGSDDTERLADFIRQRIQRC